MITKLVLPLGAFSCIGLGTAICAGWITLREGYVYYRAGVACIAVGIAMLGSWAFSSQNKDYNF